MSILIGGAFAAGAFRNGLHSETAGVPSDQMSQWLQLAPDPLGRPYNVMRARIAQQDHEDYPGLYKYRSEVAGFYNLSSWGQTYTYQWRFVAPLDWYPLDPTATVVVGQIHDVDAALVARQPTLAIEYVGSMLRVRNSFDAYPTGQVLCSIPYVPGQEYELTICGHWADGTHAPDTDGFLEVWIGDQLVASFTGRNTWADPTGTSEPNPPYVKAGVYQAGYAFPWWQGKAALIYYISVVVAMGRETPSTLRALVNAQLADNDNTKLYTPY